MGSSQVKQLCMSQQDPMRTERQIDKAMRNFKKLSDMQMSKLQTQNERLKSLRNCDEGQIDDMQKQIISLKQVNN